MTTAHTALCSGFFDVPAWLSYCLQLFSELQIQVLLRRDFADVLKGPHQWTLGKEIILNSLSGLTVLAGRPFNRDCSFSRGTTNSAREWL